MMKKLLTIIMAYFIAISLASCGNSGQDMPENKKSTSNTIEPSSIQAPSDEEDEASRFIGEAMPDFSVTTIQGETFSLSDSLKEKKAVMVNFWATWCYPCELEMPYIQEAYEKYKDKVDVIALSIESSDTDDVLKEYAKEHGLDFAIANDTGTGLDAKTGLSQIYAEDAIPATLLIDRFGIIVHYSVGAESSAEAFTTLFDSVIGDDYTNSSTLKDATYTVKITDQNREAVQGCVVNFCDESSCATIVSDENGIAQYSGAAYPYHIQIVKVPDGYDYDTSQEYTAKEKGEELAVTVTKD